MNDIFEFDVPFECIKPPNDELWSHRLLRGIVKSPGEKIQNIEVYDDESCWSSVVGMDYCVRYLFNDIAVVFHSQVERAEMLPATARLYLPREDRVIIVHGTMVIIGYCIDDLEGEIMLKGPWLCNLSEYAKDHIHKYICFF